MALSLDFSAVSDIDPYTLPAGWGLFSGDGSHFQIKNHAICVSGGYSAIALVDNPVSTGNLEVVFRISYEGSAGPDNTGAVFVAPYTDGFEGNGYFAFLEGGQFWIYSMESFQFASYIDTVEVIYTTGDWFKVVFDIENGYIHAYLGLAGAPAFGVPFYTGAYTYISGMRNGFYSADETSSFDLGILAVTCNTASATARALVFNGGKLAEITDAQLGTGLKPLVLYNDAWRERASTEGDALIIDANTIRVIQSGETLLI